MNRKRVYLLLALPVLGLVVYLAVVPAATRKTFITEFGHRTAALFGYDLAPLPEDKGLRSDHPEEYGPQPGQEPSPENQQDNAEADVATNDASTVGDR